MKNHFLVLCSLLFLVFACQPTEQDTPPENQLGGLQYDFEISAAAKTGFDKGLLLLHSFEYEDAQEAFQEAVAMDSTEVMAHWGEAMTHYKALWGLQNEEGGRAVINRLGDNPKERLQQIDNALEKDFWQAIELLYGEGTLNERNQAYAKHMANLYKKYPDNQEVAAFYALGLMWSVEEGRDPDVFDLSARVAEGILDENPNHPGALHYMIHANDDPDYAKLSLLAANKYDKVAPGAAHALHMPSHIYLALGMWNDVVASNERSYGASLDRMERKGLDDKARGYHSYAWLHYGYLQQGRFDKAAELLQDMQVFTDNTGGEKGARRYLIDMQNAQRIESGQWDLDFEPVDVKYTGLGLNSQANHHFLNALFAYDKGDKASIQMEIDTLKMRNKLAGYVVSNEKAPICSAGPTRYAPNPNDIKQCEVVIYQMEALLAQLEGDLTKAEAAMKNATQLEDECEYSYGPPQIQYPSYEQYGDWLLSQERYPEAITQFDKSLGIGQNRAKALKGKIAAFEALGKATEAEAIQATLDEFWMGGKEEVL